MFHPKLGKVKDVQGLDNRINKASQENSTYSSICYAGAFNDAEQAGAILPQVARWLHKKVAIADSAKEIMNSAHYWQAFGFNNKTSKQTLDISELTESGFIHINEFVGKGRHFRHAIYVHVSDEGTFFYQVNSPKLQVELGDSEIIGQNVPRSHTKHLMDPDTVAKFNDHLKKDNKGYVFTSMDEVERQYIDSINLKESNDHVFTSVDKLQRQDVDSIVEGSIDNGIEFKSTKAGFAQEEEAIKDLFDTLSDTPPATKAEYEANSQARYDVSRNLLPDITGEEKILLRRYGSDGVVINRQVRAYDGKPISLEEANRIFKDEKDYIEGKLRSEQGDEAGKSATVLKTKLDNFIDENYHQFFETKGYVYRASGAKKRLYKNGIQPGDIISDKANWSTSNHFGTIGYRYSSYGEGASITKLASTDEEIWFVIEKENLKGVDISGYKFENNPKLSLEEQRNKSSGEFLLKSDQKFRVKAVEKTKFKTLKREQRGRLVLLEPVNSAEMMGTNSYVIDAYNGHKLPVNVNDDFLINTHGSEGKSTLQKMGESAKKVKDVLLTPVDYPPKSVTKKKIGNSPRYTESTSILDAFSGGNTGIDSDIKGAKDIKLGKNTKTALLGPGHLAGSVLKGFAKP